MSATTSGTAVPAPVPSARVFQRPATLRTVKIMMAALVLVGVITVPGELHHGFFAAIAGPALIAPIAALVLVMSWWPRVVVTPSNVAVRNSFMAYDIPAGEIESVAMTQIGLRITTKPGRKILVAAYAQGGGPRRRGRTASMAEVIEAVETEMAQPRSSSAAGAQVTRSFQARNLYLLLGTIALAVAVSLAAAQTYH